MIAGVVVVGYWLYNKYGKKGGTTSRGSGTSNFTATSGDDFFNNAVGRTGRLSSDDSTAPECPACSQGGRCWTRVPINSVTNAAGIAGTKAYKDCVPVTTATAQR